MWCCEPSSVCNLYREFLLPRGPRARIHTPGSSHERSPHRWRAGVPRAPQPHPRPTPVTGNRVRCTIVEPRPAGSVSRLARGAGSHLPPLSTALNAVLIPPLRRRPPPSRASRYGHKHDIQKLTLAHCP